MISNGKFKGFIEGLQEFYNETLSREVMVIYKNVLDRHFDDDTIEQALLKVLETRVYPSIPKPAEFIEVMKPNKLELEGETSIAANKLRKAVSKVGAYSSIAFDDPYIHKVLNERFGGWVNFCKLSTEEFENFLKWDFPKLYQYFLYNRIKTGEIPGYFLGITDSSNKVVPEPSEIKYIGDKSKALRMQKKLSEKIGNNISYQKVLEKNKGE